MDETLAAATRGDADAIARLYEHYSPIVRRYLVRYTASSDVDDLLSDVWLRVLRRLPDYTNRGHAFTAWLYCIARSVVCDARRYERRRSSVPIEPTHWIADGPECHIDAWDARPVAALLLACLTPNQRRVIELRYLADLSILQTMAATGLSKEGVKARQHRAEVRMRHVAGR